MYYIGIDLGGTNVAAGMVDGEGRLLAKASVPCPRGAEPIADAIAQAARLAAEKAGVEMPICQCAYRVLYEGQSVREVVGALMSRNKKREVDESWI